MVDIKQLKYFIAVAQVGHVGRAAEVLNISQPPLSRQITLLEQKLGAELFTRHAKGMTLTPAGEQFLVDAKHVLASLDQACRNASQIAEGKAGALSIGFMMHAAYNIIPSLTKAFITQYPNIQLKLQEVVPGELVEQLQKGEFDAAIMMNPGLRRGLKCLRLSEEPLCLAVPEAHPLRKKACIEAADLAGEAQIVTPQKVAPILRGAIERYCREAGFEPTILLETQLQQTIISLVAEGLGIAMVPETMKKANLPGVVYRPLAQAPMVEYVILWREDNINPALGRLIEISASCFNFQCALV